ncbi:MAG: hypothetical protein ACRDIY_13750 [Chloroflexota bacterium]
MIQLPAISRGAAVWTYRSLWLAAVLLALAMPAMILLRGDLWLGPAAFDAASRPGHALVVVDGDVTLHDGMGYPLVVILGDVHVAGSTRDSLVVVDGNVFLERRAVVDDTIVVLGGRVFRAPGAVIQGTIGATVREWNGSPSASHSLDRVDLVQQVRLGLAAGLGLLLVCLVVVAVLPWSVVVTAATARRYPIRSGLAGLTGLLAMPFVVLPLTLSLVGLPLAILLGFGAVLIWLVGLTAAGFLVGRRILGSRPEQTSFLRVLIVGLAPILLALAVPVLGPLLVGAAGIVGAGARIVSFVERERAVDALATVVRGEL